MPRVLIVEDEPRMRALLVEVLAAEGHETVAVGEGMAALAVATRGEVDAAVIDVMLPGMDGFELCRQLRRHEVDMGVLLLTARAGLEDRVAGLDVLLGRSAAGSVWRSCALWRRIRAGG